MCVCVCVCAQQRSSLLNFNVTSEQEFVEFLLCVSLDLMSSQNYHTDINPFNLQFNPFQFHLLRPRT